MRIKNVFLANDNSLKIKLNNTSLNEKVMMASVEVEEYLQLLKKLLFSLNTFLSLYNK